MGWSIELLDTQTGHCLPVVPFEGGSVYAINPATGREIPQVAASIEVTFNYSKLYVMAARSIIWAQQNGLRPPVEDYVLQAVGKAGLAALHRRPAKYTITTLTLLVDELGIRPHEDSGYWVPDPGNAGKIVNLMLSWAQQHPDGSWSLV